MIADGYSCVEHLQKLFLLSTFCLHLKMQTPLRRLTLISALSSLITYLFVLSNIQVYDSHNKFVETNANVHTHQDNKLAWQHLSNDVSSLNVK
jgi:hypothetical protein